MLHQGQLIKAAIFYRRMHGTENTADTVGARASVHLTHQFYLLSLLSHRYKTNMGEKKTNNIFSITMKTVLTLRIPRKCRGASRACRQHFGNCWSKCSWKLIVECRWWLYWCSLCQFVHFFFNFQNKMCVLGGQLYACKKNCCQLTSHCQNWRVKRPFVACCILALGSLSGLVSSPLATLTT